MTNEQTRLFIATHRQDDVRQLALKASRHTDVDMPFALCQIAGWQTARQKIPTWAAIDDIIYPKHLSMEQCSSEQTARHKVNICQRLLADAIHPTTLIDLTGGLGVDFAFMAQAFDHAIYVEQQEYLCQIAQHNLPLLCLDQTKVINTDCTTALHDIHDADLIFLDPARRDQNGARAFAITDCTPDILTLEEQLLEKAHWVMVKLSPMLDWHKTMDDLQQNYPNVVKEIHIVAIDNECKELLFVLSAQEFNNSPSLHCHNDLEDFVVNLGHQEFKSSDDTLGVGELGSQGVWTDEFSIFNLQSSIKKHPLTSHLTPQKKTFLYEPNVTIMKAGCFEELTHRWPVQQLAPNSHLFFSSERLTDFPGRSFQVLRMGTMNKRQIHTLTEGIHQANVTVRNFPLSVAELYKRLKIKDGGEHYIFASTTEDNTHVLFVCRKTQK